MLKQALLQRYHALKKQQAALDHEAKQLRLEILGMLDAGCAIEHGPLHVWRRTIATARLSWDFVAQTLPPETVALLRAQIGTTETTYLHVETAAEATHRRAAAAPYMKPKEPDAVPAAPSSSPPDTPPGPDEPFLY